MYVGDPSNGVHYDPDLDAAKRHEACHCADYKKVLQQLIDLAGQPSYKSQSACESALRNFHYREKAKKAFQDSNRSIDAAPEGSPCYARGRFISPD